MNSDAGLSENEKPSTRRAFRFLPICFLKKKWLPHLLVVLPFQLAVKPMQACRGHKQQANLAVDADCLPLSSVQLKQQQQKIDEPEKLHQGASVSLHIGQITEDIRRNYCTMASTIALKMALGRMAWVAFTRSGR